MNIKRSPEDSFLAIKPKLQAYFLVWSDTIGPDEVGLELLRDFTVRAQKAVRSLRRETSRVVQGTDDESEYLTRVETCEMYVGILERNITLLDAGQQINIFDCVMAIVAFSLQEKAIKATVRENARSYAAAAN